MKSGIVLLAVFAATPAMGASPQGTPRPGAAQTTSAVNDAVDEVRSRAAQLQLMEQALEEAVARSARVVEQQLLPAVLPGMVFAGAVQARAFVLDDYGVFFDVEYPFVRGSLLRAMGMLDRMDGGMLAAFEEMRRRLDAMPDGPGQLAFRQALAGLEAEFQRSATGDELPFRGPAQTDPVAQFDPNAAYLDALSAEFAGVLKAHGLAAGIADGEWLTIAARDARGRVDPRRIPGARSTLILRVQGRDLAAIAAGHLSQEDVEALVEIR